MLQSSAAASNVIILSCFGLVCLFFFLFVIVLEQVLSGLVGDEPVWFFPFLYRSFGCPFFLLICVVFSAVSPPGRHGSDTAGDEARNSGVRYPCFVCDFRSRRCVFHLSLGSSVRCVQDWPTQNLDHGCNKNKNAPSAHTPAHTFRFRTDSKINLLPSVVSGSPP